MGERIMFGIDFYPTPREVIETMLLYSEVNDKVILEPSAGSGNIVDVLNEFGAKQVLACEIDRKLQSMLNGKCHLISDDFMNVKREDVSHVKMIVMNPPFSKAEDHFLHAWELAQPGCEIICLCNSTMIHGYGTNKKRQMIYDIISNFGSSTSLGRVFDNAERKTDVFIDMIRVFKDGEQDNGFEGFFDLDDLEDYQDKDQDGIMGYNYVRDVVGRYVEILKTWEDVRETETRMNEKLKFFPINISFSPRFESYGNSDIIDYESFRKSLQSSAWRMIFNQCNIDKYVTQKVSEDLNKFINEQVHVPFTVKNVYKMIQMVVGTHSQRMDKVLVDAFDMICQLSDLNSTAGDKWRTNTNFLIKKKFIKNYVCDYDKRWESLCQTTKISYNGMNKINDIVKALCFLSGNDYDKIPNIDRVLNVNHTPWGKPFDWAFFTCTGYKKGTMHFEFKDEKLLMLFNNRVAKIKGWSLSNEKPKKGGKKQKPGLTLFEDE